MPSTFKQKIITDSKDQFFSENVSVKAEMRPEKVEKFKFKKADPEPKTVMGKLDLFYYRYRLITGLEMLEPWERHLFSRPNTTYL